jgi:polar amino acid transport system ATP-binding protein
MTVKNANESPVISVERVSKSFGPNVVLDNVSLRIDQGSTVCLIGPSGAGKSTLIRCINWLEKPDSGAIFLNGVRVGYTSEAGAPMSSSQLVKVRARIGMVFQQFNLWPHLTVLQNVIEAPLYVQHRPRNEVVSEALSLLARVGLTDKRDSFPATLSGGEKQRVGIARALAIKPEVLLIDEPTSALDPVLVGEVLKVLKDLAVEGRTMLVVTHEMGFAQEVGDEIVFLDHGKVIETGPPETFFSKPKTELAQHFLQRYRGADAGATADNRQRI